MLLTSSSGGSCSGEDACVPWCVWLVFAAQSPEHHLTLVISFYRPLSLSQSLLPHSRRRASPGGSSSASSVDEDQLDAAYRTLAAAAVADNAGDGDDVEGLDRAAHRRMVSGALALRHLLRIKLVDDSGVGDNVDTALQAVLEAVGFFKLLRVFASNCGKGPHELLCSF